MLRRLSFSRYNTESEEFHEELLKGAQWERAAVGRQCTRVVLVVLVDLPVFRVEAHPLELLVEHAGRVGPPAPQQRAARDWRRNNGRWRHLLSDGRRRTRGTAAIGFLRARRRRRRCALALLLLRDFL